MSGTQYPSESPGSSTPHGDSAAVRALVPVLIVLILVLIMGMVGLSPLALRGISGISDDWEDLSFIGQTYGAASALLAGLALAGVIATMILQAREMKMSRELALRDSNSELLRMAMENQEYGECWGANLSTSGGKAQRQSLYTNMILSQWEMAYESHAMGDVHLRALASNLFVGRVGWEFWSRVRSIRMSTAETRRSRRFHRVLDEEFHRSTEPPVQRSEYEGNDRRPRLRSVAVGGLATGAVAVGVLLAQRYRKVPAASAVPSRCSAMRRVLQRRGQ